MSLKDNGKVAVNDTPNNQYSNLHLTPIHQCLSSVETKPAKHFVTNNTIKAKKYGKTIKDCSLTHKTVLWGKFFVKLQTIYPSAYF